MSTLTASPQALASPFDRPALDWRSLLLAVGAHLAVLAAAVMTASAINFETSDAQPIMASIIAPPAPTPIVQLRPTPPKPVVKQPDPPKKKILAAPTPAESPMAAAPTPPEPVKAPPSPPAPPEPPTTAASTPAKTTTAAAEVIQPRFDADYLNNPKPGYPSLSRRLGEEGQVMLRVFVAEDGSPKEIRLLQGSGYDRLDAAAQEAVSRWRFVPARKGNIAVAAWVQVPVSFQLRR